MSDSFINKLEESTAIKSNDFTAFDISDSNTGSFYTKKISFNTLSTKISADVVSSIQSKINTLQNNINTVAANVLTKLDKQGTSFDVKEKMSGPLVLTSTLTVNGNSDFNANVSLKNHNIKNLADPIESYDAAHKQYVDDKFSAIPVVNTTAFILKSGDTMTSGYLKLANAPQDDNDAATKKYVDDHTSAIGSYLPLNGGTMAGNVSLDSKFTITNIIDISNASADGDAVNYKYAKSNNPFNKFLPLSGGKMTGAINLDNFRIYGVPETTGATTDSDIVNKKYVDARLASPSLYLAVSGGTMFGNLNLSGNRIYNLPDATSSTSLSDAVNKKYVDSRTSALSGMLPLSGGMMTGAINLSGNRIYNLPDTTDTASLSDAVNKKYVDSKVSPSLYLPLSGGTMSGILTFAGISEKIGTASSSSVAGKTNYTLDIKTGNTFSITVPGVLGGVFTTSNAPSDSYSITIIFTQNNLAPYNIASWVIDTIPVKWAGSTAPQLTQTISKIDIFAFTKVGANWFGFIGGQNF